MLQPISQNNHTNNIVLKKNITDNGKKKYNIVGEKAASQINTDLDFQKKVVEQNERLILLSGIFTLTALFGTCLFNFKTILEMIKNSKKNKSVIIRNFESLRNNSEIPTLDNCKSINKELKNVLKQQVAYINANSDIIEEVGKPTITNRIILYGEPGTGKSYFSKILAKTIDADYKEILNSDYNSMWAGEGVQNLKNIFEDVLDTATKNPEKKYVVTFNEIDSLVVPADKIANKTHGTHWVSILEERSVFLNYVELLKEKTPNVIIIGTTNISPKKNGLDRAAMSRFQNLIEVPYPDKQCLYEALKMNLDKIKNKDMFIKTNDSKLKELAQRMEKRKFSFRNLEFVVNEAKKEHLENKLKKAESEFKIEYLEKAEKNVKFSDGEL